MTKRRPNANDPCDDGLHGLPAISGTISGADLRRFRKASMLTQTELAKQAGFSRDAVCYWESKDKVPLCNGAPAAFARTLGLPRSVGICHHYTRARGWGVTSPDPWQAWFDERCATEFARLQSLEAQRLARLRVRCGAKTRKNGACRNGSEPGKRRCKFHGGKSTGPKTLEGKATIANAQRARWAKWRATRP